MPAIMSASDQPKNAVAALSECRSCPGLRRSPPTDSASSGVSGMNRARTMVGLHGLSQRTHVPAMAHRRLWDWAKNSWSSSGLGLQAREAA